RDVALDVKVTALDAVFCRETFGGLGTGDAIPSPGPCAAKVDPDCVDATDPTQRVEVVYARPSSAPDRSATMAPQIRDMVRRANGVVHAEAAALGSTINLRVACDAGVIRVASVIVPDVSSVGASAALSQVSTALAAAGYGSSYAKYWVWLDETRSDNVAGVSTLARDDRLAADNANNRTTGYALVFGTTSYVIMLHELSHAMGAVQSSAPHATMGGHCFDGQDVMCYDEQLMSGQLGQRRLDPPLLGNAVFDPVACVAEAYDCGHDDYFNPAPSPGSYLASHWNLASPLNGFVDVS